MPARTFSLNSLRCLNILYHTLKKSLSSRMVYYYRSMIRRHSTTEARLCAATVVHAKICKFVSTRFNRSPVDIRFVIVVIGKYTPTVIALRVILSGTGRGVRLAHTLGLFCCNLPLCCPDPGACPAARILVTSWQAITHASCVMSLYPTSAALVIRALLMVLAAGALSSLALLQPAEAGNRILSEA
jgi:hypothetical protein